jgi:carboxypeptidase C (cathepsin A)
MTLFRYKLQTPGPIKMKNKLLLILILTAYFGIALADDAKKEESKPEAVTAKAENSITTHQLKINGNTIRYKAVAGTTILKNDDGDPLANFGYTAYLKEDVADLADRPIMFAFNGGPGSSSIWLHMGVLGPVLVTTEDAGFTGPPFKRIANEFSIIDRADLVMIDPVGTGYSKPIGDAEGKEFWGVDADIKTVSDFIEQYVTENSRWRSPKYLLGESYGGMRSAGVVNYMQSKHSMVFDGIILVSPFLNFSVGVDISGEDLPHVLFLPTLAATAWYHNAIDKRPDDVAEYYEQAKQFAIDVYAPALMKGNRLDADERKSVVAAMSRLLGVSEVYIERANLRIAHQQFAQELLRDRKLTAGRIDSRFTGTSLNLLSESMDYDPFGTSVGPAFVSNFLDYYHNELEFGRDKDYVVSGDLFMKWDWGHSQPGSNFPLPSPNTMPDLARAMNDNPELRVLVQQGYYDLATPAFATEYMMDHLAISKDLQNNITTELYDAGHMMYLHPPSLVKYKKDLADFIDND